MNRIKNFLKEHWLFICILVLAITLRIIYASPGIRYVGTDLSLQAYNLLKGEYNINYLWFHLGIRYVMLLLVAGIYAIFGISEVSAALLPFFASLGTITLTYVLGRYFFQKKVGLFAAFFLAIMPLDVFNATILETDGTMAFFSVLGMFFYYYAHTFNKNKFFFLAGIVFALSALTKIFGVLMLFSVISFEIINFDYAKIPKELRRVILRLLLLFLGFSIIYAPVLVWQYVETGDPLYNIHVEKNLMYAIKQFEDWPKPNYKFIPSTNDYKRFLYFMFYPVRTTPFLSSEFTDDGDDPLFNVMFYFTFIAIVHFLFRWEKRTIFLLCWFLIPFLFLENYYFIVKVQRYLTITLVPAMLLGAYFIYVASMSKKVHDYLLNKWKYLSTLLILSFLVLLLCFSIYQLGSFTIFTYNFKITDKPTRVQSYEEKIGLFLETIEEKNVYITNYQIIPILNFYTKYSKNYSGPHGYTGSTFTSFYDLHFVNNLTEINDAYVIIEPSYYRDDSDAYSYYLYHNATLNREHVSGIPPSWRPLYKDTFNQFIIFYAS